MDGLYLGVLSVSGLLAGLFAFGTVYVDLGRRGVSGPGRLLLAAGFGVSCLAGFLVPYAYEQQLRYAYFQVLEPRPIAASPSEWVAVSVATGLLISAVSVGSYFAGRRFTALRTTTDVSR